MNEQLILAIGDSIKHWERMIKYANSHINDYVFDYENMKNDIKDHWRKPWRELDSECKKRGF